MTDRFKNALYLITKGDSCNVERQSDDCRMLIHYLGKEITKEGCWEVYESIVQALTLATETEQLRKERDELAAFIRQKHDVLEVPTEIFNLCIQNR